MGYESSDLEALDSAFELLQDVGGSLPIDQMARLGQILEKEVSSQVIYVPSRRHGPRGSPPNRRTLWRQ